MARSFLGNVAKHSLEPTGAEFAQFVDQSVMRPETLMRNEEERLAYHTRENLNLADRGLIDREAVPQKALLDAKQATSQQDALMRDMVNRSLIEKPLQAEYAATGTIDPNRKQTIKYVDPKTGDTRTKTTFRNLTQPETLDESLGNLKSQGIGSNLVEQDVVSKKFVKPKSSGSSRVQSNYQRFKARGTTTTYEDMLSTTLDDVLRANKTLQGDPDMLNNVKSIVNKTISGELSPEQATLKLNDMGVTFDPNMIANSINAVNNLNEKFTPVTVLKADGTTTTANLAPTGAEHYIEYEDSSTGNEADYVDGLYEYVNKDTGDKFLRVTTSSGKPLHIPLTEKNKYKVAMTKAYKKTKNTDNIYHLEMEDIGEVKEAVKPKDKVKNKPTLLGGDNKPTEGLKQWMGNSEKANSAEYKANKNRDNKTKAFAIDAYTNLSKAEKAAARKKYPSDNVDDYDDKQLARWAGYNLLKGQGRSVEWNEESKDFEMFTSRAKLAKESTAATNRDARAKLVTYANNRSNVEDKLTFTDFNTGKGIKLAKSDNVDLEDVGGDFYVNMDIGGQKRRIKLDSSVTEHSALGEIGEHVAKLLSEIYGGSYTQAKVHKAQRALVGGR